MKTQIDFKNIKSHLTLKRILWTVAGIILFFLIDGLCGEFFDVGIQYSIERAKRERTENRLNSKIERAIAVRDFDKARELSQGYPSNWDRGKQLYNINKSQISLMIDDGMWEDAASLAKELNSYYVYEILFRENIGKLLSAQRYDIILNTLTGWINYESYDDFLGLVSYNHLNGGLYNADYNNIVDNVINHAIIEENVGLIKKCLILYKADSNGKNSKKIEAQKRVKEANITIK